MFKNKLKNYVCYNCKKFDDDLLRLPFNGFICHNCISNELDHLGVEKIKNDNNDLISIDDIINTKSFNDLSRLFLDTTNSQLERDLFE